MKFRLAVAIFTPKCSLQFADVKQFGLPVADLEERPKGPISSLHLILGKKGNQRRKKSPQSKQNKTAIPHPPSLSSRSGSATGCTVFGNYSFSSRNIGCVPLGWPGSGSVIQDLSGSWYIKGTSESMARVDSSVPLMHMIQTDLESLILIQITPKERNIRFYLARDLHIILFDSHRRNADACSFKCITYHVSRLFSRSRLTRKSQFTRKENNHDTFRPKPMLSFADKILRSINGLRTS